MEYNNKQQYDDRTAKEMTSRAQFREIFFQSVNKWYIFLISVVVTCGVAMFIILKSAPVYTRMATLLIKETNVRRSTSSDLESVLANGGMGTSTSKLVNEIVAFKSPALMRDVVRRLDLDVQYSTSGTFHDNVIYGTEVPIEVHFLDLTETQGAMLVLVPEKRGGFSISRLVTTVDGKSVKLKNVASGHFKDTLLTAAGRIVVNKSVVSEASFDVPITVKKIPELAATSCFSSCFSATEVDIKNKSDVLNLKINDVNRKRGDDILNMVMAIYNENWVADRNMISVSTSVFIKERLAALQKELSSVDADISSFKSRNLLPDVNAASSMYMTQSAETAKYLQELENQLAVSDYIRGYLKSVVGNKMIPMGGSLASTSMSMQIAEYNKLLLTRNQLLSSSSVTNPLVKDIDKSLADMKVSIEESVEAQIKSLEAQIANLHKSELKSAQKLADNPNQAKYLLTVGRQQKVMESLYMYLLQKREENELSQAFTAYNTRLITPPMGSDSPISPRKYRIMFMAIVLGFFIPFLCLYLLEIINTTVRNRKDLDMLEVPFLCEIPEYDKADAEQKTSRWRPKKKIGDKALVVVKEGKRDIVNEAFRVLRANLEFVTKGQAHCILLATSFNPGSGKTFIMMNIAIALAIKKKKVLLIDGDLRHASLSTYINSPKKGISNYLAGFEPDVDSLIVRGVNGHDGLDMLPVGTTPPNPSELVGDEAFDKLIVKLKDNYDYVFLDCPPVDIVADTQIMARVADRTLFVVRAGVLEKSMVPGIDRLMKEEKFPNMCLILNGTQRNDRKYGYQYGFKYGYRYKYSTGADKA